MGMMKNECAAIQSLHTQLGEDILLTGTWDTAEDIRELEESELWDEEISAVVCKVGSYLVRRADCLYQDDPGIYYRERKPVGKDTIAEYRRGHFSYANINKCVGIGLQFLDFYRAPYRRVTKISAKYIGGDSAVSKGWKCVCSAEESRAWWEHIKFIAAVKSGNPSSDSQETLYVLKNWEGSSHSCDCWYEFTPDGTVKEYRIYPLMNPFEIESSKEPWELVGKSENKAEKI